MVYAAGIEFETIAAMTTASRMEFIMAPPRMSQESISRPSTRFFKYERYQTGYFPDIVVIKPLLQFSKLKTILPSII